MPKDEQRRLVYTITVKSEDEARLRRLLKLMGGATTPTSLAGYSFSMGLAELSKRYKQFTR